MNRSVESNFLPARLLAAIAWGSLCALVVAPPVLASAGFNAAAAVVHFFFSPVCHQIPERSFAFLGVSLAVCHRCCGIYLGFFLGSMLKNSWMHRSLTMRRHCVIAASAPLVLDAVLPYSGLWAGNTVSRFATGVVFGIFVASLLVRGIDELLREAPWRRFAPGDSYLREASYE